MTTLVKMSSGFFSGSFARGFKQSTSSCFNGKRDMCIRSKRSFWKCIETLLRIGQEEEAERLFDKYSPRWS